MTKKFKTPSLENLKLTIDRSISLATDIDLLKLDEVSTITKDGSAIIYQYNGLRIFVKMDIPYGDRYCFASVLSQFDLDAAHHFGCKFVAVFFGADARELAYFDHQEKYADVARSFVPGWGMAKAAPKAFIWCKGFQNSDRVLLDVGQRAKSEIIKILNN